MSNERRSNVIAVMLFCFAALGFVWSAEATVRVLLRLLGV